MHTNKEFDINEDILDVEIYLFFFCLCIQLYIKDRLHFGYTEDDNQLMWKDLLFELPQSLVYVVSRCETGLRSRERFGSSELEVIHIKYRLRNLLIAYILQIWIGWFNKPVPMSRETIKSIFSPQFWHHCTVNICEAQGARLSVCRNSMDTSISRSLSPHLQDWSFVNDKKRGTQRRLCMWVFSYTSWPIHSL